MVRRGAPGEGLAEGRETELQALIESDADVARLRDDLLHDREPGGPGRVDVTLDAGSVVVSSAPRVKIATWPA